MASATEALSPATVQDIPPKHQTMASCLGTSSSPAQFIFKRVTGKGHEAEFEVVRNMFKDIKERFYGPQEEALKKIADGSDRSCRLLCDQDAPVGVVVFKRSLSDEYVSLGLGQSLEIKTLSLINPEAKPGHAYESCLLDKILQVAEKVKAKSIHVTVSEPNSDSVDFFKNMGFIILHSYNGLYIKGMTEYLMAKYLQRKDVVSTSQESQGNERKRKLEDADVPDRAKRLRRERITFRTDNSTPSKIVPKNATKQFWKEMRPTSSAVRPYPEIRPRPIKMPLKKPYVQMIVNGSKTVEGRINSGAFAKMREGQEICFFNRDESVLCRITRISSFESFEEMLKAVGVKSCLPNVNTLEDGIRIYNSLPGFRQRAAQHGVLALYLQTI